MTRVDQKTWLFAVTLSALMATLVPTLSQLDHGFMPKGGKALLLDILGTPLPRTELAAILSARRSEEDWRRILADKMKSLGAREQDTLAAYLAINMPVQNVEQILAKADEPQALSALLPRDGRELAFNECQYCHSLFTSHLTQERTYRAWMNMFESPFHRELKMSRQEREEFSRYSAINMPMKIDDVPPELRF